MIADPRPGLREFIAEHLQFVAVYAEMARQFALIGDDVGLAHTLRKVGVYLKGAGAATRDVLRENKVANAEEQGRAE